MRITGTVVSSGDIVLAGQLDGEIKCRTLVVEDEAVLTGTVNATETIVSGNLNGEVTSDVLRIKETGVSTAPSRQRVSKWKRALL